LRNHLALFSSLVLLVASCTVTHPGSGVTRIWAVDDGEKVKQDDLQHWAATSPENPVWDGTTVRLSGARNEIVAFQLVLEAAGEGARAVSVRLDSLTNGTSVLRQPSSRDSDLFRYPDRRIELFVEHYLHVPDRSSWTGYWGWWVARPLPDHEHTGWIPDALVPIEAPPGPFAHGNGGAPFTIGSGKCQTIWVDIYIPREASPGLYRGMIEVQEHGSVRSRVPVELRVFSFALSDTTHWKNFFHVDPSLLLRHPGVENNTPEYWDLFRAYMNLFHRHRADLTDGRRTPEEFNEHLVEYYSGRSYVPSLGYDGPGVGVGNSVYSIGTYDQFDAGWKSGFIPPSREAWQGAADSWERLFLRNAPHVVRFKYMKDEPLAGDFAQIAERTGWIRSSPGPGKKLEVFCTVHLNPRLYGIVDVWGLTVQSGYKDPRFDGETVGFVVDKVTERRRQGDRFALYGGTRPSFGVGNALDDFATAFRVNTWIAWKYGVDMYFQWQVGLYAEAWLNLDPWADLEVVSGTDRKWGNGSLVYSGEDRQFPRDSRGIRGPVASIRLKNFRRGQQDYEYLWLAREWGVRTDDLVDEVVPAAFDDYGSARSYTSQNQQPVWAQRGCQFEKARRALAERLEAACSGK
jgi:hypothetical protein